MALTDVVIEGLWGLAALCTFLPLAGEIVVAGDGRTGNLGTRIRGGGGRCRRGGRRDANWPRLRLLVLGRHDSDGRILRFLAWQKMEV
jgi:hypothetical protein